jgi:hypothetical protein
MRGDVRLAQVPCCTDEVARDTIWEGFGFFFLPSSALRHSAVHMPASCSVQCVGVQATLSDGA